MPAVVIATEAFRKLLEVTLHARHAPASMAIVLRGNPEYLEPSSVVALADEVLREAVQRLTTGKGDANKLIEQ